MVNPQPQSSKMQQQKIIINHEGIGWRSLLNVVNPAEDLGKEGVFSKEGKYFKWYVDYSANKENIVVGCFPITKKRVGFISCNINNDITILNECSE